MLRITSKRYEPKTLNARHHEILRMALLGLTNIDIAQRLGCTPATVSLVRNSGVGRRHAAFLRAEADTTALETAKRLREMAPLAVDVMHKLVSSESVPSSVRLNAAKDLLDRAGYAAPKQVNVHSTSLTLSGDDLESLKMVALERAKANGLVIDSTAIPSEAAC